MNTSSYCNIEIISGDKQLLSVSLDALDLPYAEEKVIGIGWDQNMEITVRRQNALPIEVRLGNELIEERSGAVLHIPLEKPFASELGQSTLTIAEGHPDEQANGTNTLFLPIFSLKFRVRPKPEVLGDYRIIVADLEKIHQGLAQDVISRGLITRGIRQNSVCTLYPQAILTLLGQIYHRLHSAVASIARQPSSLLGRSRVFGVPRAGDHVDATTLYALRTGTVYTKQEGFTSLGKTYVRRSFVSTDIEEHRHLAWGIRGLAGKAHALSERCTRTAQLLQQEKQLWGSSRKREQSVFETRDLPRIEYLQEHAAEAQQLAQSYRLLLDRHEFLADAARPATRFAPTPIFQGRAAYRQAYRALLEARQRLGLLVDGDAIRLRYRSLSTIYEYWCFLVTVEILREQLGPPSSDGTFSLIDDIYRPEFKPGQYFIFNTPNGGLAKVSYTPDIHPWKQARRRGDAYGATLTNRPLRPDIFIEMIHKSQSPVCMVLDAKSCDSFGSYKRLRDLSDYARQIFHLPSGTQPVTGVYLLHRDRNLRTIDNLPPLSTREDVSVIGAIPCIPEGVGATPGEVAAVLGNFLGSVMLSQD